MRIFNLALATTVAFTTALASDLPDADILELEEEEAYEDDEVYSTLDEDDRRL